jgi:anti-sigma-K factor RskA
MTREKTNKSAACARLETELVLFHYGELSGAERRQVEAHTKDCTACTEFLMELASLLPKTVLADDPPPEFWNDYRRELRHKLADVGERGSWWQRLFSVFRPWAMPALATAAVVVLALTFTLGKGFWKSPDARPPIDAALLEALPVAENLDFYNNLEILDAMELLEFMGEPGNGAA